MRPSMVFRVADRLPMIDLSPSQINTVSQLVPADRFSTGRSNRELHRRDISAHRGVLPAAVIWPVTTEEVSRILMVSYAEDIPVTPWGAGTSTEGNPVPTRGGLVVDLTQMNQILAIRPQDLQADVQPGVLRKELNRNTGRHGLFFPPDPGADATIGGMIANNASGVQTVKYGATKDYVMKLKVVLPQGGVIHTGCGAPKSSSGYDLTRLFVGSEGTLAAMMGSGLEPAALELLTPALINLMNREKALGLPDVPSLFCEFHGISNTTLQETAELAREICQDCGATGFAFGIEEAERKELWRARHEAWETIHRAHPGKQTLIVDAAVPISRYPEMVVLSQRLVDEKGAVGYVFGHAGDGNLHVVLVGDPAIAAEWGLLEEINDAIVMRAVELGGTSTGEHGVGIGKRKFMRREHGEGLDLMRQIKTLLDPKGLMNPGKIFL